MGERVGKKEYIKRIIQNIKPIKMVVEDIPQIAEIFVSYWGDMCLYDDCTFISIIEQNLSYVYKIQNKIIAFCLSEYCEDKDLIEIDLLCVRKGFQGFHLGNSLLSFCINYYNEFGFKNISLHVSTTNYKAFRLYRKLGFEIRHFIARYYSDEKPEDSDAYYMTLNI